MLAGGSFVHAQNVQAVNAAVLNRSARMRALSQRLVKLKAQQLLQVNLDATSDSIVATEKLISSHMQFLSSSVPATSKVRMEKLSRLSSAFIVQAKLTPTVESLVQTNALSLEVLTAADELTTEMQSFAKVKAGEVINLAGRQRMLSQRIAKNYFLIATRADTKDAPARITADRKAFSDAMKLLSESQIADAKVRQELGTLSTRYKRLDELVSDISEKGLSKANQTSVATTSEQVLASAHELTVLFEEALKTKEVSA
jgi:Type IV pili methyl-accepting chemotaxis transducer N-term